MEADRITEKLNILADAAKYDVSCASSGSKRKNENKGLGNASNGICHTYTEDGRCVSLLKILLTNHCIFDCAYCVSRKSNDIKRAAFTVQEVVDRSRQSLRSFYQHFDGKHELLLALFEDALRRSAEQIRAAAAGQSDPLVRLKVAVTLLFELSRPDPSAQRPLFTDFAPQLLVSHPAEVKIAHAPLLALFTELMTEAEAAGQLRGEVRPRRAAALVIQTVMFVAQSNGVSEDENAHPIEADEVWDFCTLGIAGD